jgi:flagellar FliJ protein
MPYRFALAPVLRLRQSIEERDLHLLEQTQLEIAHVIRLLESVGEQRLTEITTREHELLTKTSGTHLQVIETVRGRAKEVQHRLEQSLAELQRRREHQLANYEAAKRNRQVLSDLFERQHEAYEARAARERQRVTDDLFLARHRRK